jgi:hypothetical protein
MLFPSLLLVSVPHQPGVRKYVIWCLICGGILCLLGVMFLAVYFLLRSYTSTVGYFETVPPFVPATLVSSCRLSLTRLRLFWQTMEGKNKATRNHRHKSFPPPRQAAEHDGKTKASVEALNLIFTTH